MSMLPRGRSRHRTARPKTEVAARTQSLALIKGRERYVFLYDEQGKAELLETLDRYADDESLDFDAIDAEVLARQV